MGGSVFLGDWEEILATAGGGFPPSDRVIQGLWGVF